MPISITIRKYLSREERGAPPELLARIHSHPPPLTATTSRIPSCTSFRPLVFPWLHIPLVLSSNPHPSAFKMDDKPTPSSLGDIDATVPTSIPETIAPLSVRSDTDSVTHSHTAIHHVHSGALLQPHLISDASAFMQTIQPSALTVESAAEEAPPGSVHLGPSEFAVTLPMDSRVKDDYDRVLTDSAAITREFLASLTPAGQVSDSQVIPPVQVARDIS
jgi:hypothetical protein